MALKLSPEATEAIRNSLPAVAQGGVAVTTHFYGRMFANHPELKNVFNTTNQLGKRQQRALFHAIAAAGASAINDQGNYGLPQVVIDLIAHKHCALNITKDQYDIVGTELLGTIVDLLNPGQDILDGWAELYGKVAKVLYEREEELYQESESKTGGWRFKRDFIVQKRVQETKDVTSFYLVPKDGKEIASHLPGQYTTVWVRAPDWEYGQPRHYTLSDVTNGEYYRISVKKEGKVSDWLHDNAVEGSTLQLSPPYGLFTLTPESDKGDVILLSAGVGVTPVLSMLNSLLKKDEEKGLSRNVSWFHGASGKEYHSFREYVNGVQGRHGQFKATIYYSKPETEAVKGVDYHFEGRMKLADHRAEIEKPDAQYYFCGPRPWMVAVRKELTSWGVPAERLHYEVFGPALDDEEPEQ